MARFKWSKKEEKKPSRPTVSDDFIYDDPDGDAASGAASVASDTPEDALRKLRKQAEPKKETSSAEAWLRSRRGAEKKKKAGDDAGASFTGYNQAASDNDDRNGGDAPESAGAPEGRDAAGGTGSEGPAAPEAPRQRYVTSTGVELDENLQPIRADGGEKRKHPIARRVVKLLAEKEALTPNPSFDPVRRGIRRFHECSAEEQAALIREKLSPMVS